MRVLTFPHLSQIKQLTSGIDQVVHNYFKYLPEFGVELVDQKATSYDLVAGHVGQGFDIGGPFVNHVHGLHWSGDYSCNTWQYKVNAHVINACRYAKEVTVPSAWVAESFQRDMRFTPHIIPHGIDWQDWQHSNPIGDYVLYNKNRQGDVCDARSLVDLARTFEGKGHFVTTFLPTKTQCPNNTNVIGLIKHHQMKQIVQSALVYLSTTKETFGIGVLEAMASGVPVLGYAHGGNVELVQHGISGYLAAPGDIEDLSEGLRYCIKHRKTLGENGRELAKQWTWEKACEQVAEVYRLAIEPEEATVAVIIPVYNKSEDEIRRAVESGINQKTSGNTRVTDIIVVDDGSHIGREYGQIIGTFSDNRVQLKQQSNQGVAGARNNGIAESTTTYVCCLDADDWIGSRFIETCVRELEKDRSLGIVYSALKYYKPDGDTGISNWPDAWEFDKHLRKQNQIPTCCVFRREMWKRLGGYRQRYAPTGAGAEDAEFFLRAGAYGYKAKMAEPVKEVIDLHRVVSSQMKREATRQEVIHRGISAEKYDEAFDSLFHYSWLSGQVTGNPDYKEVDWLGWHPWIKDGQHPFASYATPKLYSHNVRQYDDPAVSVIIPVGPGHESEVINALDSLEAQTFRKWEAIVVFDTGWDQNELRIDKLNKILKPYPYIKWYFGPKDSGGAGYARNQGAEIARAPFLIFLDADDWLHPEYIETVLKAWKQHKSIIYTDYMNRSIISEQFLAEIEQRGRLEGILKQIPDGDETKYLTVYWSDALEYDCNRAQNQPQTDANGQFYLWTLVTSLIPKVWHDAIGGFDENMKSFEDVDYHWRLARAGHCYERIPERLVVYNYHTGQRREQGLQQHASLIEYIKQKYERIEKMGCRGCGGRRRSTTPAQTATLQKQPQALAASDDDFVMVRYMHPNKGRHQVTGGALFPQKIPGMKMRNKGSGWSIDYGQWGGGDQLLMHRRDVEANPHWFNPIPETIQASAPETVKEPLDAPAPIVDNGQNISDLEPPESLLDWEGMPVKKKLSLLDELETIVTDTEPVFDLQKLPGISGTIAERMKSNGILSKEDVLALGVDGLVKYPGIGEARASIIIRTLESE